MSMITSEISQYLASVGYLFGSEIRIPELANDGIAVIQIEAGAKPVTLVFGSTVEALTYVDSFIGSTLTTPTVLTPYNYKPSAGITASAIVRTATAVTSSGTPRGVSQIGSGNPGNSAGGSSISRPTTLAPGEKLMLRLTNKGGAAKCVSLGVYFTETI